MAYDVLFGSDCCCDYGDDCVDGIEVEMLLMAILLPQAVLLLPYQSGSRDNNRRNPRSQNLGQIGIHVRL